MIFQGHLLSYGKLKCLLLIHLVSDVFGYGLKPSTGKESKKKSAWCNLFPWQLLNAAKTLSGQNPRYSVTSVQYAPPQLSMP